MPKRKRSNRKNPPKIVEEILIEEEDVLGNQEDLLNNCLILNGDKATITPAVPPPHIEAMTERETKDEESEDDDMANNGIAYWEYDEYDPMAYMDDEDIMRVIKNNEDPYKLLEEEYESDDLPPLKRKKLSEESINNAPKNNNPSISIITWNIEKFGLSANERILEEKSKAIARILDQVHPLIMVMQEVTQADFLFDGGDIKGSKNKLTGLRNIDFFEEYKKDINLYRLFENDRKKIMAQIKSLPEKKPPPISIQQPATNAGVELVTLMNAYLDSISQDKKKLVEFKKMMLEGNTHCSLEASADEYYQLTREVNGIKEKLKPPPDTITKTTGSRKKSTLTDECKTLLKNQKKKLIESIKIVDLKYKIFQLLYQYKSPVIPDENPTESGENIKIDLTDDERILLEAKLKHNYKLSEEYAMLKGPKFAAGINLNATLDHYPVFYNKAVIHTPPRLFTYNLETGEKKELFYNDYEYTIRYGQVSNMEEIEDLRLQILDLQLVASNAQRNLKESEKAAIKRLWDEIDKLKKEKVVMEAVRYKESGELTETTKEMSVGITTNRRLVLWKFRLPINRYDLRYAFDTDDWQEQFRIDREESTEYTELYIGVVHTSPSIEIKTEITRILKYAQKLATEEGIPVLLGGDWYMEKKMKDEFAELKSNKNLHWTLIATDIETNMPGKGTGQKADHFLGQGKIFDPVFTRSLPPPMYVNGMQSETEDNAWYREYSLLEQKAWTNMSVDHTPVYSLQNIRLSPQHIKINQRKMKTNNLTGSFVKDCPFPWFPAPIKQCYISQGVQISFIQNDGGYGISRSGENDYNLNESVINDFISPVSARYPTLVIFTNEMIDYRLLSFTENPSWGYAKAILLPDGNMDKEEGVFPRGHPGKIGMSSCVFANGITIGFALILAAKANNNWYASVAYSKKNQQDLTLYNALLFTGEETFPPITEYNALICINRIYTEEKGVDDILQLVIPQLNLLGITNNKITVYQSYGRGGSNFISIGINSTGVWGEVINEEQTPYKM